jgi:hypothetical protein
MTSQTLSAHVVEAADFWRRYHTRLPIDHPVMAVAAHTLRAAGVWSANELDLPPTEEPKVSMVMQGTFCAGDRRRIVYRQQF